MQFRLRREIVPRGAALFDPVTSALHPLDGVERAIVGMLADSMHAEDLIAAVERIHPLGRPAIERRLRQLMLLGLCEGCCDSFRDQLQRLRDGGESLPRVLEGSRFSCQNAGACCHGYLFGPIDAEEKRRIESLDPRAALPQLDHGPLFIETGAGAGGTRYRLATRGDACVFFEAGPRCGLHRAFGPAAKPSLCQLYPLAAIVTVEGLRIYDRGECASFAVSARSGPAIEADLSRIRALVRRDLHHPVVTLHEAWRCDYGLVLRLSHRLEREAEGEPPLLALHRMGHVVRAAIAAMAHCPFEAGQPEGALQAVLNAPAQTLSPPESAVASNAQSGLRAVTILAQALVERVAPQEALSSLFREAALHLADGCSHASGVGLGSEHRAAATAIAMDPDCVHALRLSLRQTLFGRELLLDDHLPAGLLRMAFAALLTLAGARAFALRDRRDRVSPKHFSAGHMTVMRTLRRPEPHALLRANGEHAWSVLAALPLLERELMGRDPRPRS